MAKGTKEQIQGQMRRRGDRAKEYIRKSKEGKPCTDCGNIYHFAIMHYDHLPQFEKTRGISEMFYYSIKRIDEEIAKCELVCSNCHGMRTWTRNQAIELDKGI